VLGELGGVDGNVPQREVIGEWSWAGGHGKVRRLELGALGHSSCLLAANSSYNCLVAAVFPVLWLSCMRCRLYRQKLVSILQRAGHSRFQKTKLNTGEPCGSLLQLSFFGSSGSEKSQARFTISSKWDPTYIIFFMFFSKYVEITLFLYEQHFLFRE
jgi:hypothetical protein